MKKETEYWFFFAIIFYFTIIGLMLGAFFPHFIKEIIIVLIVGFLLVLKNIFNKLIHLEGE